MTALLTHPPQLHHDGHLLCAAHLSSRRLAQQRTDDTQVKEGQLAGRVGSGGAGLADDQAAQLVNALHHLEQVVVTGESLSRSVTCYWYLLLVPATVTCYCYLLLLPATVTCCCLFAEIGCWSGDRFLILCYACKATLHAQPGNASSCIWLPQELTTTRPVCAVQS